MPVPPREPESYSKVLGNVLGLVVALLGIGGMMLLERLTPEPKPGSVAAPVPIRQDDVKPKARKKERPQVVAPAPTPPAPTIDQEAVAKAQAALDAARNARADAEARARGASQELDTITTQVALEADAARSFEDQLKEPNARIDQAAARGGFLKAENDKLKGEVATYAQAPRPKSKVLTNKNPVARPAENIEYHFELRRGRVAFIDLEKLVALVKKDADLRIRMAGGAKSIESQVGPVGAFALQYEFRKILPTRIDDFADRRTLSYRPTGWEVVPQFEGRGETYEAGRTPVSEFARVIGRISPGKATITLWVYPDSFGLYRKLRDDLQARGYLVAGRPLPEGMAIRGGPGGSVSAGQ